MAVVATLIVCQLGGVLHPLDNGLAALRARMLERAPSGSLVVVEIDGRSLRAADAWPWDRERFARAIENLNQAGATLVAVDVDFSARSTDADDAALLAAIEANPGTVVLPTFVQPDDEVENVPLAMLARDAVLGSVNVPVDRDGKVRRYQRGYDHGDHYHASMAAVLAGAGYGETSPFLVDFGIRARDIARISFEDIYSGAFEAELVRGRNILIGATALELGDEFATPVLPSMSGVYVHALAYESLVLGRALTQLSPAVVFVLALVALFFVWPRQGPLELGGFFVRQGAVLSVVLVGPLILGALTSVSANVGLVVLAQALCVWISVHRELRRRAEEVIRQREAHLSFVALHDPETELPNRRAMLEDLSRRLNAQENGTDGIVAAVAIGVDRFALLRGAIGYGNANRVMRSLSERIRDSVGQAQVYHISTSILGAVMTASTTAEARRVFAAAATNLDTSLLLDDRPIEASLRAGAAIAEVSQVTAETLLEQASIALDQARLKTRRFVLYNAAEITDPLVQLAIVSDIGAGIARNQFELHYQAKAAARDGQIVGAEALMRWRHPVHGVIPPDRFIRVAEETGAIDVLTRWALVRAIADQAALRRAGMEQRISVNVSGRSLSDSEFCAFAIETIRAANANLCFEITETAIIEDPRAAMASIAAFRGAGVRISVDDYGSGLSSLSYLRQISADELKLDRSLVGELKTSARDRLILKSTIDLAHGLGMSVVAEGVEDAAAHALLVGMGCDSIQGYFISRPLKLEAFSAFCRAAPGVAEEPQISFSASNGR